MLTETEALTPDRAEIQAAETLRRELLEKMAGGEAQTITLTVDDARIELPRAASKVLLEALAEIAKGNGVAVVPVKPELSTQEAADLLNVSRPHLIKLLERGDIPFHRVGSHRRVRLEDALAYKRKFLDERKAALRELAAQAQELGMGYE